MKWAWQNSFPFNFRENFREYWHCFSNLLTKLSVNLSCPRLFLAGRVFITALFFIGLFWDFVSSCFNFGNSCMSRYLFQILQFIEVYIFNIIPYIFSRFSLCLTDSDPLYFKSSSLVSSMVSWSFKSALLSWAYL